MGVYGESSKGPDGNPVSIEKWTALNPYTSPLRPSRSLTGCFLGTDRRAKGVQIFINRDDD